MTIISFLSPGNESPECDIAHLSLCDVNGSDDVLVLAVSLLMKTQSGYSGPYGRVPAEYQNQLYCPMHGSHLADSRV